MSNLTTEVFGDMNYLYEHIANRDAQQLNENSDYYDEEFAELVEDIISTISLSMVYEGYSANGIISFLADSQEEDIIEKYLSFDENVITESVVSEDYIAEQLELLESKVGAAWGLLKAAGKTLFGRGPGYVPTKLAGPRAPGLLDKGKVLLSKGVEKVKDIATSAKAALTSPTAKKIGVGALGAGALIGLPYAGTKLALAGADGNKPASAKDKPASTKDKPASTKDKPASPQKLPPTSKNGSGSGNADSKSSALQPEAKTKKLSTLDAATAAASKPSAFKPAATSAQGYSSGTTAIEPNFQRRAATGPELRAAQAARAAAKAEGQSREDAEKAAVKAGVEASKQSTLKSATDAASKQTAFSPATINAASSTSPSVSGNFYDYKPSASLNLKNSYEYDAYNLVLEYLFDNGDANTIAEAEYIMTELDESFIQSLVETYHANLLAEEVTAWVNQLVEEGYDLSEYTWDDMVDYYFTKSN